jgi:hypothetical protein
LISVSSETPHYGTLERYSNASSQSSGRGQTVYIRFCSFLKRTLAPNGIAINQNTYTRSSSTHVARQINSKFLLYSLKLTSLESRTSDRSWWSVNLCHCDTTCEGSKQHAWDSNQRSSSWRNVLVIPKHHQLIVMMNRLWTASKPFHSNKFRLVSQPPGKTFDKTDGNIQKT